MSVRFAANNDRVSYSGSAPPATFTITCWVYLSVDRNDYSTWLRLWTSGIATVVSWSTEADGTSGPNYFTASGSISNTTGLTAGQWRKIAITRTGSSGQAMVAAPGGPTEVDSGTVSSSVPAGITLGGRSPGDATEQFNGRLAHVRVWDGVLTQTQIEAEWDSATPVTTSGLWADWPLETHTDLTDHSGNGRNLSAGTSSATTEDGPPIPTGITGELAATLPLPVASVAAQVTNPAQLSATLPLPVADLAGAVTSPGELAATLPLPTLEATADVTTTGELAAGLPLPVLDVTADVLVAGELAAVLPLPVVSVVAGAGSTTGELAASLPLPVAAIAADVTDPAALAAQLPLPAVSIAGTVTAAGELSAVLPLPIARFTTTPPISGPLHAGDVTDHPGLTAADVTDHLGLHAVLT